jgi:hypothetical protein
MRLEENERHLAAADEGDGRDRDTRRDEQTAEEFNDPGGAALRQE